LKNTDIRRILHLSGLSLIEVLISLLLLSVVAAFVALSIPTSAGLSTTTDDMEITTALAQKYIEDVKVAYTNDTQKFKDLQNGTISSTEPITIESKHTNNNEYSLTANTQQLGFVDINGETVLSLFELTVTVAPIANGSPDLDSSQAVTITATVRRGSN